MSLSPVSTKMRWAGKVALVVAIVLAVLIIYAVVAGGRAEGIPEVTEKCVRGHLDATCSSALTDAHAACAKVHGTPVTHRCVMTKIAENCRSAVSAAYHKAAYDKCK
jgi:hypothetical protein